MKKYFAVLLCLLLAPKIYALLGDPEASSGPPKALFEHPYTWEWKGGGNPISQMTFNPDGTGKNQEWDFQWRLKDAQTIELWTMKHPKDKTFMHFTADYSSYEALDFNHERHIIGHQVISKTVSTPPPAPPPAVAGNNPSPGGVTNGAYGTTGQNAPGAPLQPITPETQKTASGFITAYHNSLVFVTGKEGDGSGFIAKIGGNNYLVTNAHVAADLNDATFRCLDGSAIQPGTPSIAVGRDIFCMGQPAGGKAIEVMQAVDENAAVGDDVVVLGNAQGGGVINTIIGKIVGIGPNLVEVDAPFVPGNSGSPIIHLKSGKVVGVATYTMTYNYDETTKEKVAKPVVRRFGYRIDNVQTWQKVDWQSFRAQAAEMEKIETLTEDLGAFFRDIVENNGGVTPEKHTNPAIKNRIDEWLEAKSRRLSVADQIQVNSNFLSFLKIACQSDVTAARRTMTYDYFQRELADEQKTRDAMTKAFQEIIKEISK